MAKKAIKRKTSQKVVKPRNRSAQDATLINLRKMKRDVESLHERIDYMKTDLQEAIDENDDLKSEVRKLSKAFEKHLITVVGRAHPIEPPTAPEAEPLDEESDSEKLT